MKILSYQQIKALQEVSPKKSNKLPGSQPLNLNAWEHEIVAVLGSRSGCKTLLKQILLDTNLAMPEKASIKHLYKQPKSENWLNNSETIFTHIIKAVEAAQPSLSEIEKNALAEVYLRAAFLQNYRSCKPNALSNSLQKQVILALIFASADRVVMLPDIFIQSDFPERALLQRILQNLRLIHENHKIILFLTQQPEEAIFMADRILVVSNKSPNLVGEIIPVRFHEPRNRWIISELPVFKNTLKRLTNLLTDTFAHEDLFTYSPHIKTS